jgi:hypothetical protein
MNKGITYFVFYNSKGERKDKEIVLPAKAKEIGCKIIGEYRSKQHVKMIYLIGKKKKEKIIHLPNDAEEISVMNPDW